MKVAIVGAAGSGKSTLIRKLTAAIPARPLGFATMRCPAGANGNATVHIHAYIGEKPKSLDNQIGVCGPENGTGLPEGFEKAGLPLLTGLPPGSLVVMDEIGFMESCSPAFCQAVLDILSGDYDVLAAVSSKDTPFLRQVRAHPDVRIYEIGEWDRDTLYLRILADFSEDPGCRGEKPL